MHTENLTFDVKVTLEDIKAFLKYHYQHNIRLKVMKIVLVILGVFIVTLNMLLEDYIYLVLGVIFIICALVFSKIIGTVRSKQILKSSNNFEEIISYTVNNNGFHTKGSIHNSTMLWEGFYKVAESKTLFLLYQNKFMAIIIPKRDLSNEQMNRFKNIISQQKKVKRFELNNG